MTKTFWLNFFLDTVYNLWKTPDLNLPGSWSIGLLVPVGRWTAANVANTGQWRRSRRWGCPWAVQRSASCGFSPDHSACPSEDSARCVELPAHHISRSSCSPLTVCTRPENTDMKVIENIATLRLGWIDVNANKTDTIVKKETQQKKTNKKTEKTHKIHSLNTERAQKLWLLK